MCTGFEEVLPALVEAFAGDSAAAVTADSVAASGIGVGTEAAGVAAGADAAGAAVTADSVLASGIGVGTEAAGVASGGAVAAGVTDTALAGGQSAADLLGGLVTPESVAASGIGVGTEAAGAASDAAAVGAAAAGAPVVEMGKDFVQGSALPSVANAAAAATGSGAVGDLLSTAGTAKDVLSIAGAGASLLGGLAAASAIKAATQPVQPAQAPQVGSIIQPPANTSQAVNATQARKNAPLLPGDLKGTTSTFLTAGGVPSSSLNLGKATLLGGASLLGAPS